MWIQDLKSYLPECFALEHKQAGCSWLCQGNFKKTFHYCAQFQHYLYETLLDPTIPHNDENININGYQLLRVDHPNDIRRRGICMYFKES